MLRSTIHTEKPLSYSPLRGNEDTILHCCTCNGALVRNGFTRAGKQRFLCRNCGHSKVLYPATNGYGNSLDARIVQFTKEGVGIRGTSRLIGASPATVIRRILAIADGIATPKIPANLRFAQVDELHTHSRGKKVYVIFSWSPELKRVLSLAVGTRSRTNLQKVVQPLLGMDIEKINTDRYPGYKDVVPKKKHTTIKRRNNNIERQNLNLRTHLKRLNRKTICSSKSTTMLLAVVKIYFWG